MIFVNSSGKASESTSNSTKKHVTRTIMRLTAIVVGAVLGGCAATQAPVAPQEVLSTSSPPELKRKVVADRAEARWQALIGSDLDRAYTFMSPASRDSTSLEAYKAKIKPGMWRDAKVDAVDCDGDACTVKLMITYDHPMMKGVKTPLSESWIIDHGKAWYVFRG